MDIINAGQFYARPRVRAGNDDEDPNAEFGRERARSVVGDPGGPVALPPQESERRLLTVERLTRKFDEAERRIRRLVTQQVERQTRIKKPYNIDALSAGLYAKAGSRAAYDVQRLGDPDRLATIAGDAAAPGRAMPHERYHPAPGGGFASETELSLAEAVEGRDVLRRMSRTPGGSGQAGIALLNQARRLAHGDPTLL